MVDLILLEMNTDNTRAMELLQQYEKFFKLQRRDQEKKYEQYANTPLSSLFADGRAYYGSIVGTTTHGQMVLHFETKVSPRLKVPMVVCIVKRKAYEAFGEHFYDWNCTSIKFRENYGTHSDFSDILPLYFLKERNTIGCGQVSTEMLKAVKAALEQHINLKFVMLETLPPTELLMNLADYIKLHPTDKNLTLQPTISYDQWKPVELKSTDNVADKVISTLEKQNVCVLQGPPGTGKSYTLASIISKITDEKKSVCVTTQSNASLISLISQETMKPLIERGTISKTVLSAEEQKKHPFLIPADKSLLVAEGSLLCSTYYSLSRIINKVDNPIYDLIVIEEASQAFLTAISAFMKLGKKCLIVGDPMQLPPVVDIINAADYKDIDVATQSNGMLTYICATDVPSYRMTTSFRLTPVSTSQSKYFYGGHFTSVQKKKTLFDVPSDMKPFFPEEGGTLVYTTKGSSGANCSDDAMAIIRKIVAVFNGYYPKRRLAILSPFVLTTKALQTEFCNDEQKLDLLVETINRIQGETVDYTIYYVPLRNHSFAFSDNLFNVATSLSRSTTLLITDMPLDIIPISSNKVRQFLSECKPVDFTQNCDIDRNAIKLYYPGLEQLVDTLLDHNIKFSFDGDVDLLDHNGLVIATSGMILTEHNIAIDPVDNNSKAIFEAAGYRTINSNDFDINMLK